MACVTHKGMPDHNLKILSCSIEAAQWIRVGGCVCIGQLAGVNRSDSEHEGKRVKLESKKQATNAK